MVGEDAGHVGTQIGTEGNFVHGGGGGVVVGFEKGRSNEGFGGEPTADFSSGR